MESDREKPVLSAARTCILFIGHVLPRRLREAIVGDALEQLSSAQAASTWGVLRIYFSFALFVSVFVSGGFLYVLLAKGSAVDQVRAFLDVVELFLPKRLREEDATDAREVFKKLEDEGAPAWKLWLKCTSTTIWLTSNAVRELVSAFMGRKAK